MVGMAEEKLSIEAIAHVGIRVHDLERSLRFYQLLGFEKTKGPIGPEPVAILMHPAGIEINLVLNAVSPDTPNVLMDVPGKAPGITHLALRCPDVEAAAALLAAKGFPIKDGPVRFPGGALGVFVRDPDGIVIELHQPAPV
jgi:lactoylglutathione lyase